MILDGIDIRNINYKHKGINIRCNYYSIDKRCTVEYCGKKYYFESSNEAEKFIDNIKR